jgi:peroxiredoxin Q/BCP
MQNDYETRREAMGVSVGEKAPEFTLQGTEGGPVTLSSFRGKQHVVLVFYPGDNTPG